MSRSSEIVDAAIKAMGERPLDFTIGEHTMKDAHSGLEFWIANTPLNAGVYKPFKFNFNPIQCIRFKRYVNRLKSWQAENLLAHKAVKS